MLERTAIIISILFVILSILLQVLVDATKIGSGYLPSQYGLIHGIRELLRILWVSGGISRMIRNVMLGLSFVGGIKIFLLLLKNQDKITLYLKSRKVDPSDTPVAASVKEFIL